MSSGAHSSVPRAMLLQWPWYPCVAAIYPLWFLYLRNPGQASLSAVALLTVCALAVTLLILSTTMRLLRSRDAGALVTAILVGAFYAYGPLHDLAVRLVARGEGSGALRLLGLTFENHISLSSLVVGLVVGAAVLLIRRIDRNTHQLTGACNVAAGVLGAFLLVRVALDAMSHEGAVTKTDPAMTSGTRTSLLGYNPDIYYIVVDGYARADVLREYYDFDNGPFIGELRRREFAVNDRSNANYNYTFLSLASSLNFAYLQDFAADLIDAPELREGREGFEKVSELLQDNRASHFLRARGYRFVHLQSSSPETIRNPYADEEIACAGRMFDDEYFRAVVEMSWLKALALSSMVTDDLAECHQLRMKSLGDQANRPGPKFVFAHFLPPHHPYLFDREGNVLRRATISNQFDFQARLWEHKAGYLGQLEYLNSQLLEVVDRILAQSRHPPIIILQSDHGPNLRRDLTEQEARAVRFANFAAYFLPGAPPGLLPPDCAPVNQFRYLFNHYFAADFSILPFRSWFSEFKTPLQMNEITLTPPETGVPR